MKTKTRFILGFTYILLACFLLNSCNQGPVDVSEEIRLANKAFMEAFNNADANAMANLYTEDAKVHPPNSKAIEGRDAINEFWNQAIHEGGTTLLLETITAERSGNIAVEDGEYTIYVNEDIVVDQGKYIIEWNRVDGQWKLNKDMWNSSNPMPQLRAVSNDTVWVIANHIKPDKVKQFEEYNNIYLGPAAAKYNLQMKNTVRILRSVKENKDGTYTYFFLMDPVISKFGYSMRDPLIAEYGEEKAKEYLDMFVDCLKGKQEFNVTVQTGW